MAGTVGTIVTLALQANLSSPVTIVVGVVVRLAQQLDWFDGNSSPAVGNPNLASGPPDVASWTV